LANELAEKEKTTASIAITLREDFLTKFILKTPSSKVDRFYWSGG
jgi:hypothetical protein